MKEISYLNKRGFDEETIKSFNLEDIPEKELVNIYYFDNDGKQLYCRTNFYGDKHPDPKYKSPAKKHLRDGHSWLYGLWKLGDVKDAKDLLLIEGEYNTISSWIMGFSSLGIGGQQIPLKECHLVHIPESVKRITVLYDVEEIALKRAVEIDSFFNGEKEILITKYPDKRDANDYLVEHKGGEFAKIISSAKPLPDSKQKKPCSQMITKLVKGDLMIDIIHPEDKKDSSLVIYNSRSKETLIRRSYKIDDVEYKPYYSKNFDERKTVKIAKELIGYGTTAKLTKDIERFINKYVDIPNAIDVKLAAKYVLLSYVYGRFGSISYLRAIGEYGCGKSRLLDVLNICYKAIPTSATTTLAPMFRVIERYGGTMIIDEAELSGRGERFDDLKDLLRHGNNRGSRLLRCVGKDHDVQSFDVFGPKILGSRRPYNDDALESRIIDIRMKETKSREIVLQLDEGFEEESDELRSKLLRWGLDNYHNINTEAYKEHIDYDISMRINQMISPLVCIGYDDKDFINGLFDKARETHVKLREDKAMSLEANLTKILNNFHINGKDKPMIADIIEKLGIYDKAEHHPRFIAGIIRKQLNLDTGRIGNGTYVIFDEDTIKDLMKEYNICIVEQKENTIITDDIPF